MQRVMMVVLLCTMRLSIGHNETVELLIAKGADVNAKNNYGNTPLDLASGETVNFLRKHGGKTGAELKAEGK